MKARFNRIYDEQKDAVYAYLLYMTKDAETAKDLSPGYFFENIPQSVSLSRRLQ